MTFSNDPYSSSMLSLLDKVSITKSTGCDGKSARKWREGVKSIQSEPFRPGKQIERNERLRRNETAY